MRMAGIKLNEVEKEQKEVEKEQKEDARKLKSYLEQKRPPLISRPKQAPHLAPKLGGQLIPPYAGFFLQRTPARYRPTIPRK
jgi:hypothetical protein